MTAKHTDHWSVVAVSYDCEKAVSIHMTFVHCKGLPLEPQRVTPGIHGTDAHINALNLCREAR